MIIDAIVLAGGRASRLGGASKAAMQYDGRTLLQAAIGAISSARRIAVVGDASEIEAAAPGADVIVTREIPPFAGPAAAIAAALDRLAADGSPSADFTFVVACDMPHVAEVVAVLLAALRAGSDGAVAVSPDGRVQHLACLYSTRRLRDCVADHRTIGDLEGLSVRALVSGLKPDAVGTPTGVTDDVDTWLDAERLGVVAAHPRSSQEDLMPDDSAAARSDALLRDWCAALLRRLDLDDVEVDIDAVLSLAGKVAHGVVRPAAPLTAFVVGYAVGRATERDSVTDAQAFSDAASAARDLASDGSFGPAE